MARSKKIVETVATPENPVSMLTGTGIPTTEIAPENFTSNQPIKFVDKIEISKEEWDKVQEQLKMLTAVADKGRMFNYESQQAQQKKPIKVKLSVYNDQYIVGWKTIKDELIKHPTTGLTVGEVQEYEVSLLSKTGISTTAKIIGYPAFSDARYTQRVECEVIGKSEDYNGNLEFDLVLPEGQKIKLPSQFIN
jgi:hypothetical protein